jgi:bleomycin hydrolase
MEVKGNVMPTSKRNRKSARAGKSAGQSKYMLKGAALTPELLSEFKKGFESKPTYRLLQNAVTQVSVQSIINDRRIVASADHSFSVMLDDWAVTDQKRSGRCWMFAGLNLLRVGAMKKMNLKEFEFSQNFVLFWDQFEKSNYFLEAILDTADRDLGDRTVAFLLRHPLQDGGQWNMFVDVVRKHGLVPKAAMPETESSSNTSVMNGLISSKLRQGAKELRELFARVASPAQLRQAKEEILTAVHRILCIHLGTPPERFDWQWVDKKKKFHRQANLTPRTFAQRYVTVPIDDYVCLVHDPRKTSPMGKVFTVQYLGNVVGGDIVRYLNIDVELMKSIAMRTLKSGEAVWFGCDVGKHMDRALGLWDARLQDYGPLYETSFDLDKASRLEYGQACMTHAMLFTGVDIVGGKPRRWRVENSWGETGGKKGFYLMNDSWFSEHMFEIAARGKYLPPKLQEALSEEPIVLPPWDPMGSLAR